MLGVHFISPFQKIDMKRKLNCVLLIDDDQPTNFLHEIILKKMDCAERIVAKQSGRAALEFLKSVTDGEHPQPDLIFLDINMPAMNGWEFLIEYEKLSDIQKGRIVVVMLTTSLNPDDKQKASERESIAGFRNKPLSESMIMDILHEHFETWL